MSWSRILRFARERQVPVIVTDETGEDPLILLSLDQLEEALGGAVEPSPSPMPAPRPPTPSFVPEPTPSPLEGGGEFHLEEEEKDQVVVEEVPTQAQELAEEVLPTDVAIEQEQPQEIAREEETPTPVPEEDSRFTTQEGYDGGYGEIVVAPQIEVSPLITEVLKEEEVPEEASQEEGVIVKEPQEEPEAPAPNVEPEAVPSVIWEEGGLPMPQGEVPLEEVVEEEKEPSEEVVPVSEAAPQAPEALKTEPEVSLEERFFLDY